MSFINELFFLFLFIFCYYVTLAIIKRYVVTKSVIFHIVSCETFFLS